VLPKAAAELAKDKVTQRSTDAKGSSHMVDTVEVTVDSEEPEPAPVPPDTGDTIIVTDSGGAKPDTDLALKVGEDRARVEQLERENDELKNAVLALESRLSALEVSDEVQIAAVEELAAEAETSKEHKEDEAPTYVHPVHRSFSDWVNH
jgi:hypothetical protein